MSIQQTIYSSHLNLVYQTKFRARSCACSLYTRPATAQRLDLSTATTVQCPNSAISDLDIELQNVTSCFEKKISRMLQYYTATSPQDPNASSEPESRISHPRLSPPRNSPAFPEHLQHREPHRVGIVAIATSCDVESSLLFYRVPLQLSSVDMFRSHSPRFSRVSARCNSTPSASPLSAIALRSASFTSTRVASVQIRCVCPVDGSMVDG